MKRRAKIFYAAMDDFWRKEEKLAWLRENPISKIAFESVTPDEKYNWINQTDNDWDSLIPVGDKDVKLGRKDGAIFELFSLGVVTARNEWAYDLKAEILGQKIQYLIDSYNVDLKHFKGKKKEDIKAEIGARDNRDIKWTRAVIDDITENKKYTFSSDKIIESTFRPFILSSLYFSSELNEMRYQMPKVFAYENKVIAFSGEGSSKPFHALAQNRVYDHDLLEKTQCLPFHRYDSDGTRHDNITDWAVEEFARRGSRGLTKEDIFHYVYAVLHYPPYREKYEQNLKREFPRIPVYSMVPYWSSFGRALMELHLNYETVEPYPLVRKEIEPLLRHKNAGAGNKNLVAIAPGSDRNDGRGADAFIPRPVTKLRADEETGVIEIDSHTSLEGVPAIAWEYKLGNRSALEWVLDQYKERKPKDPTIAEKFNTYKFADYKDHVIDLLKRVCTVSVKTMEIIKSMPEERDQSGSGLSG